MTKWTAPDIASIRGDNSRPLQKIFGSLTEYLKDYQNGYTLDSLDDVTITTPSVGQVLSYDATNSLWINTTGSVITDLNASNLASGTVPTGRVSGSYVGITGVGTLTTGTVPATLLSGTVASARISGSYTGITGVGTLAAGSIPASLLTGTTLPATIVTSSLTSVGTITSGTWSGSFGAVSGANLTSLNASNISSGTLNNARLPSAATTITSVGTLTGLTTTGQVTISRGALGTTAGNELVFIDPNGTTSNGDKVDTRLIRNSNGVDWTTAVWRIGRLVDTTRMGFIQFGDGTGSQDVRFGVGTTTYGVVNTGGFSGAGSGLTSLNASNLSSGTVASARIAGAYTGITSVGTLTATTTTGQFEAQNTNIFISGTSGSFFQHASNTGSGQACQWATVFGNYFLVRNTSTRADKENIQPLNGVLTPEMVDEIDVSLWNRTIAPNIPEVGPMAEDMNDISPFLATHGMDVDEDGNICQTPPNGISPNGWMSLLTIALQDTRQRLQQLETA